MEPLIIVIALCVTGLIGLISLRFGQDSREQPPASEKDDRPGTTWQALF
jgi:hypothetical protein